MAFKSSYLSLLSLILGTVIQTYASDTAQVLTMYSSECSSAKFFYYLAFSSKSSFCAKGTNTCSNGGNFSSCVADLPLGSYPPLPQFDDLQIVNYQMFQSSSCDSNSMINALAGFPVNRCMGRSSSYKIIKLSSDQAQLQEISCSDSACSQNCTTTSYSLSQKGNELDSSSLQTLDSSNASSSTNGSCYSMSSGITGLISTSSASVYVQPYLVNASSAISDSSSATANATANATATETPAGSAQSLSFSVASVAIVVSSVLGMALF